MGPTRKPGEGLWIRAPVLTIHGHQCTLMSMIKATASQLKAKMGRYMKAVREGKEVLVTDRDRPVARLVPMQAAEEASGLVSSAPRDPTAPPLGDVAVEGLGRRGTDSTAMLLEDRARR